MFIKGCCQGDVQYKVVQQTKSLLVLTSINMGPLQLFLLINLSRVPDLVADGRD